MHWQNWQIIKRASIPLPQRAEGILPLLPLLPTLAIIFAYFFLFSILLSAEYLLYIPKENMIRSNWEEKGKQQMKAACRLGNVALVFLWSSDRS